MIEIVSTWIVEDGGVRPMGTKAPARRGRPSVAAAKAELERRRRARAPRQPRAK